MTRVRKDDPELAPIKARLDDANHRLYALHEKLQEPMDDDRRATLRRQYREVAEELGRASDDYAHFHYARGDFSIPVPE